jgi:hypothetical protein
MAGPRGRAHRGRTGAFNPDASIKAATQLHPGDPARVAYEELIAEMGISGSEVIRQALLTLRKQRAAGQQQTCLQEAV